MRLLRVRSFGLLGSSLEVLVGLRCIGSLTGSEHDDPTGFETTLLVFGALLVTSGVVGLVLCARRAVDRRARARGRTGRTSAGVR